MNARKPLIYLALFLVLGLVYYFYEYKGGAERQKESDLDKKALAFSADSVSAFHVLRRDSLGVDSLVLVHSPQTGWRITWPLAADADSAAVARLIRSAADAAVDRVVEDSAASLAPFGLDNPELILSLQVEGKPELRLALGAKNPTGSFIYAVNLDRPRRVLLLNSWTRTDLDKHATDLRDRKALHFASEQVESLSLERGASTLFSARLSDSGAWELNVPLAAPAESDSLKELLRAVEQTEALSFVDSLPDTGLKAFGLDSPALTLSLSGQKGEIERRLFFGSKDPGGNYYARRQGMENVYVLPAALVERLLLDPARLRDRALVHAVRERIDSLALARPGEAPVAARKDSAGVWSLLVPERSRADGSQVDGLLWDLKDLRARQFADPLPARLAAAFQQPLLTASVAAAGAVTRLEFARASAADSLVWVRVTGLPGVAAVDSSVLGRLDPGGRDLRYRKIFEFDTGTVNRVSLEYPDHKLEVEKKGDTWQLTAPEKAPAKEWKVQNLLWDIEGVNFESIVSESGADSLSQGFGKPSARVGLFKGDSLVAQAAFGDSLEAGRSVYLRRSGAARTFKVPMSLLRGLPAKADDLKSDEPKPEQK